MPAGEQRHADEPQRALLADDRLGDFLFYAQGAAAPVLQQFFGRDRVRSIQACGGMIDRRSHRGFGGSASPAASV